jgi:hypothetical protein
MFPLLLSCVTRRSRTHPPDVELYEAVVIPELMIEGQMDALFLDFVVYRKFASYEKGESDACREYEGSLCLFFSQFHPLA